MICIILSAVLLVGCNKGGDTLGAVFPDDNAVKGWNLDGGADLYSEENLYDLVDGQADAFFAYGFVQVGVQRYRNRPGDMLRVHVWELAAPADAYGLFTSNTATYS